MNYEDFINCSFQGVLPIHLTFENATGQILFTNLLLKYLGKWSGAPLPFGFLLTSWGGFNKQSVCLSNKYLFGIWWPLITLTSLLSQLILCSPLCPCSISPGLAFCSAAGKALAWVFHSLLRTWIQRVYHLWPVMGNSGPPVEGDIFAQWDLTISFTSHPIMSLKKALCISFL